MKILEKLVQIIVGTCLFFATISYVVNSCSSNSDEGRHEVIPTPNVNQDTNSSSYDESSTLSYSDDDEDDSPEIEIEVPSGHWEYVRKQVPCHVCDGQGFKPSNLTASGQVRCGFCSGKGYETVTEQEWVE